jgi:hypothetical protein
MKFPPHAIALAVLASLALPGHADDGLKQTTITMYAGGKPVGGLIFPIGTEVKLSAVANTVSEGAMQTRFTGNVEGRFTPQAGQSIVLFGEDLMAATETVSAERAQAVRDLEAMASSDQLYRGRMLDGGNLTQDEWKRQTDIDVANMQRLAQIVDRFGWPGLRFAGAASQTAFLVLQHATPDVQRRYLPLLRNAVQRQDALGAHLALLEDRVRVASGKPQLYGTQLNGDPLRFDPIEDEAHVDERRRSVGLPTMAEYAKMFGLSYPAR